MLERWGYQSYMVVAKKVGIRSYRLEVTYDLFLIKNQHRTVPESSQDLAYTGCPAHQPLSQLRQGPEQDRNRQGAPNGRHPLPNFLDDWPTGLNGFHSRQDAPGCQTIPQPSRQGYAPG